VAPKGLKADHIPHRERPCAQVSGTGRVGRGAQLRGVQTGLGLLAYCQRVLAFAPPTASTPPGLRFGACPGASGLRLCRRAKQERDGLVGLRAAPWPIDCLRGRRRTRESKKRDHYRSTESSRRSREKPRRNSARGSASLIPRGRSCSAHPSGTTSRFFASRYFAAPDPQAERDARVAFHGIPHRLVDADDADVVMP
jgi:hypothetical protein